MEGSGGGDGREMVWKRRWPGKKETKGKEAKE
jgi:hypothetical protein